MKTWPTKKLGEVTQIENGGTPNTNRHEYWNGEILWLTPRELANFHDVEITDTERKISTSGLKNSSARLLPVGTVLLTSRAPIGYVAIAGVPLATNQGFKNFICDEKFINNRFLFYFLVLKTQYLKSLGRGATFTEVSKDIVSNVKIPLPPLQIQKQIVERLDKIAEARKLNDDLIQKADELFQSLLHQELDLAGKDWEVKKLGELFEITSSKRVFESEWTKQGVPFYRAREIVSLAKNQTIRNPIFISEKMFEEYKKKYGVPQEGDILVTGVGTLGISYVVKNKDRFYFKDGNIIWLKKIPNSDASSQFVEYFFQTPKFKQQIEATSAGATVRTYTIRTAQATKILLPPPETQKQIVAKLSAAQEYKKQLLEQKSKLKELFDSVLHRSISSRQVNR